MSFRENRRNCGVRTKTSPERLKMSEKTIRTKRSTPEQIPTEGLEPEVKSKKRTRGLEIKVTCNTII